MTPDVQRHVESMRQSASGAILCIAFSERLELIKTALCSASGDQVTRLQGQAAAYLEMLKQFSK